MSSLNNNPGKSKVESKTEANAPCGDGAKPQDEHRWLEQMLGEWVYESEAHMGEEEPDKFAGTESVRSIGGLWVMAEGHSQTPAGQPGNTIMTLGYDPEARKFVGTWVGSMMTHMWVYSGELDAQKKILTLNCEGPSFDKKGETAQYQDIIEIVSPDHRILRSQTRLSDGQWNHFMTAHYRRK